MRIDLHTRTPQAAETGQASKSEVRSRRGGPSSVTSGDRTQISSDAARIGQLSAAAQQTPEIRQEKVASLAALVARGAYSVPADKTADAMVSEMLARSTMIR
jgi:flagellar biosynthesis anti-sigma factor FlgM